MAQIADQTSSRFWRSQKWCGGRFDSAASASGVAACRLSAGGRPKHSINREGGYDNAKHGAKGFSDSFSDCRKPVSACENIFRSPLCVDKPWI